VGRESPWERNHLHGVADTNGSVGEHPAVQGDGAVELATDPTKHVKVLRTAVGVDRGDDAAVPKGVHPDERRPDA
jgi:hypothetical protein